MTIAFLFIAALTPEALGNAVTQMKTAETQSKTACAIATQIKAARMQLELMQEAKDFSGQGASAIEELEQEAKTNCAAAAPALANAAKILRGGTADAPDDDKEIAPEAVKDNKPRPAFTGPAISIPLDMKPRLEVLEKVLGAGWAPYGSPKDAKTKRMEWSVPLEAGKCYAFIGVGSQSVKRVALYMFDAHGKQRSQAKSKEVSTTLYFCPFVSADYHLQAKVKRPEGGYLVGGYVR